MKILNFLFPLFLICCYTAHPQTEEVKNAVFLELLGNGGVYSLNVERKLTSNFYGRVGFGSWTSEGFWSDEESSITTFPVMGNMLFGGGANKLEIGAGFLAGRNSFKSNFGEENDRRTGIFSLIGVVGYRYQKPAGGFLARIGLTPFLDLTGKENAYPDTGLFLSGGVSLGYSF